VVHQSQLHTDDGQCHCSHKCSDVIQAGAISFTTYGVPETLAVGLSVYSNLVLGGKPKGLQKIKRCGGKCRGLQKDEADDKGRKNGSGNLVKNIL